MSVNKQILIGRVGQDGEFKALPNGTPVLNFSVATSKRLKGAEETQWHRCILYGKLAEAIYPYVMKGTQLYVEGETRHRKYMSKAGVETYITEVIVSQVELLGSKQKHEAKEGHPGADAWDGSQDIPF